MINVMCPQCQMALQVEDSQAGQTITCACGAQVAIPAAAPGQPPAACCTEGGDVSKDHRMWGMFCHLAAFAGFIGIPFGNILGPLIIWMIKREESPFIDQQGKNALNFQISMAIYFIVAAVLTVIFIGFFLAVGLVILDVVMIILASVKANDGKTHEYPICIKFLK